MSATPSVAVPSGAAALLAGAVDYAGLFPPAGLGMAAAAAEYAHALTGPEAWLLGRFVAPAARLPELTDARAAGPATPAWRVSAIVTGESAADLAAIAGFNQHAPTLAVVDAVECRPSSIDGIDWLAAQVQVRPGETFVEVPLDETMPAWLARIAACGLAAKIRTGGVTAAAFPAPAAIVAFLDGVTRLGLRFKATAGLHHAVRGAYRLTYEPDAAQAPMYGYLNVLLAAATLRAGGSPAEAEHVLLAGDAATLTFTDDAVRWAGRDFAAPLLRDLRTRLAGFGSCSFREPAAELRALAAVHS